MPTSDQDRLVGTILDDRYRVVRAIGKGGMGSVYEGENVNIGRRVAIKVLLPELIRSEEYVTRFQREARAAAEIGHAHIVDVFDFGQTPAGLPYIIMEYLEGEGLDRLLDREEMLPPDRAVDIAGQLLHALSAAHGAGIIHRDLKPENIFLCSRSDVSWQGTRGERPRDFVKVLDFGISLFRRSEEEGSKITQTGVIFGTPYYMSPEQARASRDIDFRSDIYAVGALLYTMISGIRPFDGDSAVEILSSVIDGDYKKLDRVVPGLEPALARAVDTAMAVNPYKRYESAIDFMNALLPFSGQESSVPRLERVSDRETVADVPPDAGNALTEKVSTIPQYRKSTDPEPGADDPEITSPDAPPDGPSASYRAADPRPTREDTPRSTTSRRVDETPKTLTLTSEQPARPSRVPLYVTLAILVLGAATIITLASINAGRAGQKPAPPEEAPASGPVASTPDELRPSQEDSLNIELVIDGAPAGASIYLDGHFFGKLPQTTTVRADGRDHSVRVAMEGYEPQVKTVTLHMQKASERVEFDLVAEAVVVPTKAEEEQPVKAKPAKKPVRLKIPSAEDLYGKDPKKVKIPSADDLYK